MQCSLKIIECNICQKFVNFLREAFFLPEKDTLHYLDCIINFADFLVDSVFFKSSLPTNFLYIQLNSRLLDFGHLYYLWTLHSARSSIKFSKHITVNGVYMSTKIFIMPKTGKMMHFFGPKSKILNFSLNLFIRLF